MTSKAMRHGATFGPVYIPSWTDVGAVCGLTVAAAVGASSSGDIAAAFSAQALVSLALLSVAVVALLSASRRRAGRHLGRAIRTLELMASGELPSHVDVPPDGPERRILSAVDRITQHLRHTLSSVQRSAAACLEQADQMNRVAWAMLDTCEGTVKQASAASAEADDVSHQMQIVAAATEEMDSTIRNVAKHAADASSIATSGAHQVGDAATTMSELHVASTRAEEMLQLISRIASQTHILSLNATIEAARAGKNGKGFAVVAGEVKELARQTAMATERVKQSVNEIKAGSTGVADAMTLVTETINRVTDNQQGIASSVEEQTLVTSSIGASSSQAAGLATSLAANVAALTRAVRTTAYSGASARAAAGELSAVQSTLDAALNTYTFEPIAEERATASGWSGISRDGAVTTIEDFVQGDDLGQWEYNGMWGHATANVESAGSNAHSCMPGDTATIRFTGSRIRFYGVGAPNHGRASVSVDGEEPTIVDMYDPRVQVMRQLYYESGPLDDIEHTLVVTVLGECNENSRYVWINVDAVEIED